jgi:flagella basal body P-ring formation protein FlgA
MKRFVALALALAAPWAASAEEQAEPAAPAVVRVPGDAVVDQGSIRLGDIALVDGLAPELEDAVSALELGPSAAPDEVRALSGHAITERLHAVDAGLAVEIPETVHVRTASREVGPDEVRERLEAAIRHRMPWSGASVRFARWSLPHAFAVPLHAERVLVRFAPGEDFRGRVAAELEFVSRAEPELPGVRRSASTELEVELPVAVAATDLRRGNLAPGALELEARDLRHLPDDVVTDLEQVAGLRLLRNLSAGTPLRMVHFDTPDLVERGDLILVDAGNDGLELRLQVKALRAGKLGQVIEVENPTSRRRFTVEVTGRASARLALPSLETR